MMESMVNSELNSKLDSEPTITSTTKPMQKKSFTDFLQNSNEPQNFFMCNFCGLQY